MILPVVFVLVVLLQFADAKCFQYSSVCISNGSGSYRNINQYQNATAFYTFYADIVTQYYSDTSCTEPTYTEVRHFTYDKAICLGEVKSVSVRVESTKDAHMQSLVKECGSKLTKDFVDISTLSCTVDGAHPFADELRTVGSSMYRCIAFQNGEPVLSDMKADDKCASEFNMGMSWLSGTVVAVVVVFIVLVIASIVTIVYVFIKRGAKNNDKSNTQEFAV